MSICFLGKIQTDLSLKKASSERLTERVKINKPHKASFSEGGVSHKADGGS